MGFIRIIPFFFVLFILPLSAQEEEIILWDANTKLSWADFKGEPTNTRAAAVTASGLTYSFSTLRKNDAVVEVNFEVKSHFYPNESWYRPEVCDTVILKHEQLHFDITELYARKFLERLNKATFTNKAKAEVKAIYNQINTELNEYQNLYDAETNFSRNREQQVIWEIRLNKLLKD
ncbi:DUF922 domain-containing protein [Cellulophaga sp. E16_2]|uniref:DUF922 domain-containing protein n=1 Tax=unclassified Cellulophaga TaxID=2634405 RepID=UPI0013FE0A15|nr:MULTISPECIES: DUF922 domain-containing protein [unclassified Cellulophaga]MBO0592297.1 DUF922 domain-containing protein [Cellulophaga sp. E16_2]